MWFLFVLVSIKLFDKTRDFSPLDKLKKQYFKYLHKTVNSTVFQKIVIFSIALKALITGVVVITIILAITGVWIDISMLSTDIEVNFKSLGLTISTVISGTLALAGLVSYPISKKRAFLFFRYYLLFSIFIVQFFLFWANQFDALTGLFFDILALQTVNIILKESKNE